MHFSGKRLLPLALFAAFGIGNYGFVTADDVSEADAWQALARYEYGQDMTAMLAIDRAVIEAMASPDSRAACAVRLADLLAEETTTAAARQYICLQLRQVGTSAEVPRLANLLASPGTSEMARQALEAIPGQASAAALRDALKTLNGKPLVGVINSVGVRKDADAVAALAGLTEAGDKQVAVASLWALGAIADEQAAAFLVDLASKSESPTPQELAVPLLRCAVSFQQAGKPESAKPIFDRLCQPGQSAGVRRAALEGLLDLQADDATATILAWFADRSDVERRQVASGHLRSLPDEQLDQLLENLADLPDAGKLAVIELATSRRGKAMLPMVLSMAQSDNAELRLAGVRCLGMLSDASSIGLLIDLFAAGDESTTVAQDALASLPRKEVTAALLEALDARPEIRMPVIDVLIQLRCYDAIDPLIEIASRADPAVCDPALYGLRGIADPDKTDIPRLVKLLLRTEPGRHRDEVEKTILIVSEKLPEGADRSELVLASLASVDRLEAAKYLPVLGRLGGAKALDMIRSALDDPDADIQAAAVRGLCNWPNADVADPLLDLATNSENRTFRHWALRAYVRVVTLDSERPEAETLAMLQNAMKLAENADDKRLVLQRASTVRTMDAVNWIAKYLDDPELAPAACLSIVELAHHRFLRHPNMQRFGPILDQVSRISQDAEVVERAKRYRLGL